MIKIDFTNLSFNINENGNLPLDFTDVRNKILNRNQGFLDLPFEQGNLAKVIEFTNQRSEKYSNIVLIGIGGSSLGPKCIFQALGQRSNKQVYIVDNIDPDEIYMLDSKLDYTQTLFLVVTKSGTTPETIATYLYFRERANQLQLNPGDHFVFVTDPENGYLREQGKQEQITMFDLPQNVGGRFSVLSNVGLVFSALLGVDIAQMLSGAAQVTSEFLGDESGSTSSWNLAKAQFFSGQNMQNIVVIFPYSSRLNSFGDWYVQLLSESIGKEFDLDGKKVNVGLTPLPAVGATDQHSQLQLFKEGPDDKLIIFLNVLSFENQVKIPSISHKGLEYLSNHTFNELIQAEYQATKQSLTESHKSNISIEIPEVNAFYLGQLFQTMELSVACIGELYNINTFDQPGVERGKVLTKEILIG
jgi:glucose-6-phosphate isomerase